MPWFRKRRARPASSASSVVTMPPSPVVTCLTGWRLKIVRSLSRADRPAAVLGAERVGGVLDDQEPAVRGPAPASRRGRRAGRRSRPAPPRASAASARPRGATGSRLRVSARMSAKTGRAAEVEERRWRCATNVSGVVTTSSPGPTPAANIAACSAAVPELTATAWRAPTRAAKRASNSATVGPGRQQVRPQHGDDGRRRRPRRSAGGRRAAGSRGRAGRPRWPAAQSRASSFMAAWRQPLRVGLAGVAEAGAGTLAAPRGRRRPTTDDRLQHEQVVELQRPGDSRPRRSAPRAASRRAGCR